VGVIQALIAAAWLSAATGCFSEKSFPLSADDVVRVSPDGGADAKRSTRTWLRAAHQRLENLLPTGPDVLLTEDLVGADGRPIDVLAHFNVRPDQLNSLFCNFLGLLHTAQASATDDVDKPAAAPWPGFEDVWIPVADGVELAGRLAFAEGPGGRRPADCIVILPGMLGDNAVQRTFDLATGLRAMGFHVLALELRGHGATDERYPEVYYTFGVIEAGDLMAVSEWLEKLPEVRRTGLVGFCYGANQALLAAWNDGRPGGDAIIPPELEGRLRPVSPARHFEAGIIAFSPVLRFEEIVDDLKSPQPFSRRPLLATLQDTIRVRMERKKHPRIVGDLDLLMRFECAGTVLSYPNAYEESLQFLRFLPHRGKPSGRKLQSARVPVLIVSAANDPLTSAQYVAQLIARTDNPHVAAVVLPGGGHVGFAPYARRYYFSLIVNYFRRTTGATRP
jgi:predicted alpha/beta-fold hydrolase